MNLCTSAARRCVASIRTKTVIRSNKLINDLSYRHINLQSNKVENKIIQRWIRYWEDLIKDYSDVVKETVENHIQNPRKAIAVWSLFGFGCLCFKTNPNEISYRDDIIKCSNEVILVDKVVRNPKIDQYITSLENCNNLGILRRLSIGIASVMWVDDYSDELGIYKATCVNSKPQYLTFFNRIIDIGFLGRWWKLNLLMKDYDVNSDEWEGKDKLVGQ